MSEPFGQHAGRLASCGYEPIPIWPRTKKPAIDNWRQAGCPRERWGEFADCGTGILTRYTPALDIDALDEQLAGSIQDMADELLGDAPVRIGQRPKRLMPFQLRGDPFPKLKIEWRSGRAVALHPPTKPPGVEFLADGQQFVALGIHPDTGRPYTWQRDPDLMIPRALLPGVDRAKAERFMRVLARALPFAGCADIHLTGVRDERREAKPRPRPASEGDAERIQLALERVGNRDLHYDDWVRIGHAVKASLGDGGLPLFDWWSSLSAKYDERTTRKKFASFNPRLITAGSIFWEAGR